MEWKWFTAELKLKWHKLQVVIIEWEKTIQEQRLIFFLKLNLVHSVLKYVYSIEYIQG